jgi:hypothetical protein
MKILTQQEAVRKDQLYYAGLQLGNEKFVHDSQMFFIEKLPIYMKELFSKHISNLLCLIRYKFKQSPALPSNLKAHALTFKYLVLGGKENNGQKEIICEVMAALKDTVAVEVLEGKLSNSMLKALRYQKPSIIIVTEVDASVAEFLRYGLPTCSPNLLVIILNVDLSATPLEMDVVRYEISSYSEKDRNLLFEQYFHSGVPDKIDLDYSKLLRAFLANTRNSTPHEMVAQIEKLLIN